MALVTSRELIKEAYRARRAVAAFNVITLEHAEAVAQAAENAAMPVIIQLSENAARFHNGRVEPIALAAAAIARTANAPVALHLDHVTEPTLVTDALGSPFSSIMYDAGALPYAENVARTGEMARRAHAAGLWVEAELGYVGGKPDAPLSAHAEGARTDPDEAVAFVAETGVDALAVAVGSKHAMRERTARLDLDLIADLRSQLDVPLVLHGSSGVPDEQLRAAVSAGMTKINIGTALNLAMTRSVRASLAADESVVDPRVYLAPARQEMSRIAEHLLTVCGGG
jgi:fructose-bisphosphate aldolase, class II